MTTGSPGNNTPLIEARGLHTFYGDSHILHGLDITIHKSETVSLIGRNGMGKTTLLRTLIGFTPPRQGTLKVHGRDIKKTKVHKIVLQGIAYVPDDRGIFPNLSVHENLIMAARSGPNGRDDWPLSRVLELFPQFLKKIFLSCLIAFERHAKTFDWSISLGFLLHGFQRKLFVHPASSFKCSLI